MPSCKELSTIIVFYVFIALPLSLLNRFAHLYRWVTRIGATRERNEEGYYEWKLLPFWSLVLEIPRQILLWCAVNRLKALIAWGRKRWANPRE